MFVIIESTFFLFFGLGLIATHVVMSLHIASGIEVKSGGIMSVYCLHEWNFKYDFGWVALCSMVLFGTAFGAAFHQKRETEEQPNETSIYAASWQSASRKTTVSQFPC